MNKDQDHHMLDTHTHTHHFMKSLLFIIHSKDHHSMLLEETSHQQEKKTWPKDIHSTQIDKEAHLDRAAQEIETECFFNWSYNQKTKLPNGNGSPDDTLYEVSISKHNDNYFLINSL